MCILIRYRSLFTGRGGGVQDGEIVEGKTLQLPFCAPLPLQYGQNFKLLFSNYPKHFSRTKKRAHPYHRFTPNICVSPLQHGYNFFCPPPFCRGKTSLALPPTILKPPLPVTNDWSLKPNLELGFNKGGGDHANVDQ